MIVYWTLPFIVLFCSCGVSEVNSRGYIISQTQKEEVPLKGEEANP